MTNTNKGIMGLVRENFREREREREREKRISTKVSTQRLKLYDIRRRTLSCHIARIQKLGVGTKADGQTPKSRLPIDDKTTPYAKLPSIKRKKGKKKEEKRMNRLFPPKKKINSKDSRGNFVFLKIINETIKFLFGFLANMIIKIVVTFCF